MCRKLQRSGCRTRWQGKYRMPFCMGTAVRRASRMSGAVIIDDRVKSFMQSGARQLKCCFSGVRSTHHTDLDCESRHLRRRRRWPTRSCRWVHGQFYTRVENSNHVVLGYSSHFALNVYCEQWSENTAEELDFWQCLSSTFNDWL